jgi:hypothetical protein
MYNNNIVKLSKTKIIVICHSITYEYYANIVERYREIFSSHTFRRDNMYFEFDYNNKIDYNDDKYIVIVVECIKNIFDNLKNKLNIELKINNSILIVTKLIQKIVDLDYFSYIYFEREFYSNKIDFRGLQKCLRIIYKNSFYENSLLLPTNLESITLDLNCKYDKNVIFNIPNGLKEIFTTKYNHVNFLSNIINIKIKKLIIINGIIDIKNTTTFYHDYDFLIIKKFCSQNIKYIDFNNLPYTLKILHIHDKINQEIIALPNSIVELKINYYDKNLLENLPCTLTKIYLDFSIGIENINFFSFLSNSLEEIIINNIILPNHVKLFNIKLPIGLKKLSIIRQSRNFDFILSNFLISNNKKCKIYKYNNVWKTIEFL